MNKQTIKLRGRRGIRGLYHKMSKRSLFGRARDAIRISRHNARAEKKRRSGFIRYKIDSRYPTDGMFIRIWKSKYYNGQYRGR